MDSYARRIPPINVLITNRGIKWSILMFVYLDNVKDRYWTEIAYESIFISQINITQIRKTWSKG